MFERGNYGNPSCSEPRTLDALIEKLVTYALTDTENWYSGVLPEPAGFAGNVEMRKQP